MFDEEVFLSEDMLDPTAEVLGVALFTQTMLVELATKRFQGPPEKYTGFHRNPPGMTPEEHDQCLIRWLREKVEQENWVAVGNLAMMLYHRQTQGIIPGEAKGKGQPEAGA